MRVRVEQCWGGGDNLYFRLTLPNGDRDRVSGDKWTRQVATEALDLLEKVYGLVRHNVRFCHH